MILDIYLAEYTLGSSTEKTRSAGPRVIEH